MTARCPTRSARRPGISPDRLRRAGACLLALAVLAPAGGLAQPPAQDAGTGPSRYPRIRPTGPRAAYTLGRGLELCPTIRALAAALEDSDVIVYIAVRPRTSGPAASIAFLGASSVSRFLRVTLRTDLSTPQMISLMGHELQHALEVAGATGIRDRKSFDAHYRCTGLDTPDPKKFDTREAMRVGDRVRKELATAGIVR